MEPTIKDEISSLRTHSVTINVALLLALIIMGCTMGYIVHRVTMQYEAKLAAAKTTEQFYKDVSDKARQTTEEETAKRVELEKQQAAMTKEMEERQTDVTKRVTEVMKPSKAMQETALDAKDYLHPISMQIVPDLNAIAFSQRDVQDFIVTKIERDQYEKDKSSLKKQWFLEQQKAKSFSYEMAQKDIQIKRCQDALVAYKEVAGATKKQKILGALKHVGEAAAIGFVGYEIGAHIR